jgi:3-deoxy-D-arabino-heptulosonate 7-phosphate (DAHP) synthase
MPYSARPPWNFPKAHSHSHLFNDIKAKGVTRNSNTKPNEQLHGILKAYYRNTNYKDVDSQVCRMLSLDCNMLSAR